MTDLEMLREAARLMRAAADSRWSAVANWLDWAAYIGAHVGGEGAVVPTSWKHVVAVARAYLRREP